MITGPQPEGVSPTRAVESGAPAPMAKISTATSLADLVADYVFFTHAPAMCWCSSKNYTAPDLLQDFVNTQPVNIRVPFLSFSSRVFDGASRGDITKEHYNHCVHLFPRSLWGVFSTFASSAILLDRERNFGAVLRWHEITILDHLAADGKSLTWPPPAVKAFALLAHSNHWSTGVVDGSLQAEAIYRPRFFRTMVCPEIQLFINNALAHTGGMATMEGSSL